MEREQYAIMARREERHWWYTGMRKVALAVLDRHLAGRHGLRLLRQRRTQINPHPWTAAFSLLADCTHGQDEFHAASFSVSLKFAENQVGTCQRAD